MSKQELKGRVALVTGASRNIGRAIALDLAAAGAAVVVNALQAREEAAAVVREIEQHGGQALLALADVADEARVQGMIDAAVKRFGRLDIVVNNAAVRREEPIEQISLAEFRAVVAIILDAAFMTARAALPYLKSSGGAAIVNIGGMTGHSGAADRVHVVAAKAGLAGLTKALAHELAPVGVTVNCVVPGMIDTVRQSNREIPLVHRRNPPLVGRRGKPEEVAAMVRHLCGPAGRFITGQTIHVNGGAFMG
ncbi:MAG TPA: SDR family oxidoreductase [Stellaceae bacterium]|nr:SDR family oxidoreductase [Stellaceae bacterium]